MPLDITYESLRAQLETLESQPKIDPIQVCFNEGTLTGPYAPRFQRLMTVIRRQATGFMGSSIASEVCDKYMPENFVIISSPLSMRPGQCAHNLPPSEMNVFHSSGMCMTWGPKIINLADEAQWASILRELELWDQQWERTHRITVDRMSSQG